MNKKWYNIWDILTRLEAIEIKWYYIILYHQWIKWLSDWQYPKWFWNMYYEEELENYNPKSELIFQCETENKPYIILQHLRKEKEFLFKIVQKKEKLSLEDLSIDYINLIKEIIEKWNKYNIWDVYWVNKKIYKKFLLLESFWLVERIWNIKDISYIISNSGIDLLCNFNLWRKII